MVCYLFNRRAQDNATLRQLRDFTFRAVINPGEGRVNPDTDCALCNTAQRERKKGREEGESQSRVFALHVLKSLSLSLSVSHTLGPCAAATSRAAAESIGARESTGERVREGMGGAGGGRREREIEREEALKITGRVNTEDKALGWQSELGRGEREF